MVHADRLRDKVSEDILINCADKKDFGCTINSKFSEDDNQFENQSKSEAADKLPVGNGNTPGAQNKLKMREH
jgi:hypothetical protein